MKRAPSLPLPFPVAGGRRPRDARELFAWVTSKKGEHYVAIQADDGDYVVVRRRLLLDAKSALRRFADLRLAVLDQAVRFSWHGGRGGLYLRDVAGVTKGEPLPEGRIYFKDVLGDNSIGNAPLLRRAA